MHRAWIICDIIYSFLNFIRFPFGVVDLMSQIVFYCREDSLEIVSDAHRGIINSNFYFFVGRHMRELHLYENLDISKKLVKI